MDILPTLGYGGPKLRNRAELRAAMETTQNRIWAKARAFKQTIAAKIFGLAVFLLLLTIGLAGFLLWEVARTGANPQDRCASGCAAHRVHLTHS